MMLNEYQERGLSVTLRVLEENLVEIEKVLNSTDYHGTLIDKTNNIGLSVRDALLKRSQLIKARIQAITERFGLEKIHKKTDSEISAELSYCWEILVDAKVDKLKRYGEVKEGLKEMLDPDLDAIIGIVLEMQSCLTGKDQ